MIDVDALATEDPPGIDGRGRVAVTSHAQLAYLGRVDATEQYPAARVRERWRRSRRSTHPNARRGPEGLYLVYDVPDDDFAKILTVYPSRGAADHV